jgi:hypothetical protein
MTTYLYQIQKIVEEAQEMGGACSLAIVEEQHFKRTGALASDHILDDLIGACKNPDMELEEAIEELAESMFISYLEPDDLRDLFNRCGIFKETVLFADDQ